MPAMVTSVFPPASRPSELSVSCVATASPVAASAADAGERDHRARQPDAAAISQILAAINAVAVCRFQAWLGHTVLAEALDVEVARL